MSWIYNSTLPTPLREELITSINKKLHLATTSRKRSRLLIGLELTTTFQRWPIIDSSRLGKRLLIPSTERTFGRNAYYFDTAFFWPTSVCVKCCFTDSTNSCSACSFWCSVHGFWGFVHNRNVFHKLACALHWQSQQLLNSVLDSAEQMATIIIIELVTHK